MGHQNEAAGWAREHKKANPEEGNAKREEKNEEE